MRASLLPLISLVLLNAPAHAVHPCKKLVKLCKDAGYHRHGHKQGKGLLLDCMRPLGEGKTVAGVTADPADVAACRKTKPHGG